LLDVLLELLQPSPGGVYVDVTLGGGGHGEAILDRASPSGVLVGIDRDLDALRHARERLSRFGDRLRLVHGSFGELGRLLDEQGLAEVSGILADLGLSSSQLRDPERGFSFAREGPLDMRFDRSQPVTAAELLNTLDQRELADAIFRFGEERRSRAIARRIVLRRPLRVTSELRRAVVSVLGPARRGGIDPATRTFQALRIAVNQELEALEKLLAQGPERLRLGGRMVVISYHSLEDRATKRSFASLARSEPPRFRLLTRRPLRPEEEEVNRNPRARSARLRALERIAS
jgi:16S rRNA (cytosine1402-N4)-methyltransferase